MRHRGGQGIERILQIDSVNDNNETIGTLDIPWIHLNWCMEFLVAIDYDLHDITEGTFGTHPDPQHRR